MTMQLQISVVFTDPATKPPAVLECLTFYDKGWAWGGHETIHSGSAESPEDCLSLCKSLDKEMFTWYISQHGDQELKKCLCKMKDGGYLVDNEGQVTGEVSCTGKFHSYQQFYYQFVSNG